MNKKMFVSLVAAVAPLFGMAQTMTEWKDMQVNEVNRLPVHSTAFPFESLEAAKRDMTQSKKFLSIDGDWKFYWTPNADDTLPENFYLPEFNDSTWAYMKVPGMWELQKSPDGRTNLQRSQQDTYGVPVYVNIGYAWKGRAWNTPPTPPIERNHIGLYRRQIIVPSDWKGEQVIMHLGSVTSCVYVWVNGQFVGYSEDSKIAAEFDITPYVKSGVNHVALQVYRWCDGSYCEDQDFWRFSGIARQSYLYARNAQTRIDNLQLTANADGLLKINADVIGTSDINFVLSDANGNKVDSVMVNATGSGRIDATIKVQNPKLWSAETPYLYNLTAQVMPKVAKGKKVAKNMNLSETVLTQRVGFRTVEIKNGQLLVNGKAVLIKGVDRHELDPDFGYCVPMDRMMQDLKRLKEFNFNAVRTCHYPDDPRWYDLCDEYGIYLVAEANQESHGFGYHQVEKDGKPNPAFTDLFAKQILERNQHNVMAHFNHPSIITWSMGNETIFSDNFAAAYHWIKSVDQSRPVQYEQAKEGDCTDIFCPMYFSHESSERYSTDASKKKPLIQCEYAHAMGNSGGGFKEYWDLIRKYPRYQGGFIWDFADQGLAVRPGVYYYGGDFDKTDGSDNNFNCNGVFQPDRTPNPQAYEIRYQQQDIWTRMVDFNSGRIAIFNENFFRPLDYVTLHWQLLNDGKVVKEGDMNIAQLNIQPQQTAEVNIPYGTADLKGEVMLNVSYRLINDQPLLAAGHEVAAQQFVNTPYDFNDAIAQAIPEGDLAKLNLLLQKKLAEQKKKGTAPHYASPAALSFDNVRPNFWRAPTDNDMGANLQRKYKLWRNPKMELKQSASVSAKVNFFDKKETVTIMTNIFDMPEVKAELTMTFTTYPGGVVELVQTMKPYGKEEMPNMFRFGILADLPFEAQDLKYYGRGPWENYSDRSSGALLGVYEQTVKEQFFPYIRPQETGTKTDARWLEIAGYRIFSDKPFTFSALNYTQDEMDETRVADDKMVDGYTPEKHQRHPADLRRTDHVELSLNSIETGVGGVDSWSGNAEALAPYRVKFGEQTMRLFFMPK